MNAFKIVFGDSLSDKTKILLSRLSNVVIGLVQFWNKAPTDVNDLSRLKK